MASRITFNEVEKKNTGANTVTEKRFAKIAPGNDNSEAGANIAILITDDDSAAFWFGEGSGMHKSAIHHFRTGGNAFYGIAPANNVVGSVGAITSSNGTGTKQGLGDLTVNSGSTAVEGSFKYVVKIVASGGDGSGKFMYSKDNGKTWSSIYTFLGATIALEGGVTLDVTYDGVTPENSFIIGDEYHFETVAPGYDETNLEASLAALDAVQDYSIVNISTPVTEGFCNTLHSWIVGKRNEKQWVRAIVALSNQGQSETDSDYTQRLFNFGDTFYSEHIAVHTMYFYSQILSGELHNFGEYMTSILSQCEAHWSPGWVEKFPLKDVVDFYNWELFKSLHFQLEDKGLNTAYYEDGEAAGAFPFFDIGQVKAQPGASWRKIPTARVYDKGLRVTHAAVLPYLRANAERKKATPGTNAGLLMLKGQIETNLLDMQKEANITKYSVIIPLLDENYTLEELAGELLSGKGKAKVEITPNPHISEIEVDTLVLEG